MIKIPEKIRTIEKALPRLGSLMEHCALCARKCGVNRLEGETGFCASGKDPIVFSYSPHHGEEPPLSGLRGSGTIFFSHCNMHCIYCQNYQFSQTGEGKELSPGKLGTVMMELQRMGCHNINLVSPTHFVPGIAEALKYAYSEGLDLPVVYNTGGYDSLELIKVLDGIIDIYLPDMRYSSDEMAKRYSSAPGYVANNRAIVKEMHRQVGNLALKKGIAQRGLIIRLLILPGGISGTTGTLEFIANEISRDTYLSVMSQYYPAYKAMSYKELSHRISSGDYHPVIRKMRELELEKGWVQPFRGDFDERFAGENFPSSF